MSINGESYHKTAREMVEAWDQGETIWTVEMGGLGPSYEQAIQLLMVELVRDHLDDVFDDATPPPDNSWGDATVHRVNEWPDCGFSGAQVGAAKVIAYKFLKLGPRAALMEFHEQNPDQPERVTMVSKSWPHEPEKEIVA